LACSREQIADRDVPAVVELMDGYRRLFLDTRPTDGDAAKYKVIVVVFTDLPADRAPGVFDSVLEQLAVPSYLMPPTGGPEGTLAGVARWVDETETSFRESVPRQG
jgi:hypothetical protein